MTPVIPVKRLSPSSMSTLDTCEMKWVLQYVMGYREPSGRAAVLGTIGHYVLECVARAKKLRDIGRKSEKDEIVGRITTSYDIQELIDKSYNYFTQEESHIEFAAKDYREVCRNIEKAKIHEMFPEKHGEILQTEYRFNLESGEWGDYAYVEGGEVKKGRINLVGVVDLIFRDKDGVLNIIDYKFGQAKDWVTGKKKDYAGIIKDIQLCMYYYAMRKEYPEEDININLWYVKQNIIFSSIFGKDQEEILVGKIRSSLNKIRSIEKPRTSYSYKCGFCAFKKTNFENWDRPDLDMSYDKVGGLCKFDDVDDKVCVCDATKMFFHYRGLTATIEGGKK